MNARALIQRLAGDGIRLTAKGYHLHVVAPPGAITDDLRALLANRKADLVAELTGLRATMLTLAETECLDAGMVRALPESELTAIAEQLADYDAIKLREALRVYLQTLAEDKTMREGKLPPAYDTPAKCRHCGPVWLPRAQAALLDMVDGWPTTWGCPWCFIDTPRGVRIPRPSQAEHSNPNGDWEGVAT